MKKLLEAIITANFNKDPKNEYDPTLLRNRAARDAVRAKRHEKGGDIKSVGAVDSYVNDSTAINQYTGKAYPKKHKVKLGPVDITAIVKQAKKGAKKRFGIFPVTKKRILRRARLLKDAIKNTYQSEIDANHQEEVDAINNIGKPKALALSNEIKNHQPTTKDKIVYRGLGSDQANDLLDSIAKTNNNDRHAIHTLKMFSSTSTKPELAMNFSHMRHRKNGNEKHVIAIHIPKGSKVLDIKGSYKLPSSWDDFSNTEEMVHGEHEILLHPNAKLKVRRKPTIYTNKSSFDDEPHHVHVWHAYMIDDGAKTNIE